MIENVTSGRPTREFIIRTITKDIRIDSAIFDLIDNSINAAEVVSKSKKLNGYYVSITVNEDYIKIEDNCGGFTKEKVLNGALRIGGSLSEQSGYGVGMKRAILKFGREIIIKSNSENYSFIAEINSSTFGVNDNWDINLKKFPREQINSYGVSISVSDLYSDISNTFKKASFKNNLFTNISTKYRYKLTNGFKISLNGEEVLPQFPNGNLIAESPWNVNRDYQMQVKVKLYNNIPRNTDNGWDIIINGRCILERDKSKITQWHKKLIKQGCSYERFVGEVLIEGDDIKKLPVWSTKDNIDVDSVAFQYILNRMYDLVDANRAGFKKECINIQYEESADKVQFLKEKYGTTIAKEVGEKSFVEALNKYDYKNRL